MVDGSIDPKPKGLSINVCKFNFLCHVERYKQTTGPGKESVGLRVKKIY